MKTVVLYNPLAGRGHGKEAAEKLAAASVGKVTCQDITTVENYPELFAGLGAEDRVILCGGDGTINRFVNATEGVEIHCEVLYTAVGTGNDFLKDLGKTEDAEPFSLLPYIKNLPFVEVNGEKCRFLNGVGFGIDGYCCEIGDKMKEKAPDKPVNYTAIAIKGLLFHYKPTTATVTVDGVSHTYKKVWIAATMKGRYYGGGMMNAPKQDRLNETGEVTLILFHGKGRLKTLIAFPSIFEGKHIEHENMVAVHTGKNIRVEFDAPTALQIDGETRLNVREYQVTAEAKVGASV